MRSVVGFALALTAVASPVVIDTIHKDAAPVLSSTNAENIPNSYMVMFKDHVTSADAEAHHEWVQEVHLQKESLRTELRKRSQVSMQEEIFRGLKHTYNIPGFLGYSGHFDDATLEAIRNHPDVAFVEMDSVVHTTKEKSTVDNSAPWGLARVSHRKGLTFSTLHKYLYASNAGEGVDAYVIDTGTNTDHVDFEGRAHWGQTIPEGDEDVDGNGHGTHCSGTIAGKKYGVAKKANVYAVKVLRSNGSGTMSDVVKGVEWAANAHSKAVEAAKKGKRKGFKGSVANMSLGGGKVNILDAAVNAAVDAGMHFSVAAGNDNADACNYSPAAAKNAMTVGASDIMDDRASFSNYGKCTDIFAPGVNIPSTWIGSKYATNVISGTSMASPHMCGLMAYFVSLQPKSDSAYSVAEIAPKKLKAHIISVATQDALSDIPSDTVNLLAWNGGGKTNYSEIIHDGGYKLDRESVPEVNLLDKASHIRDELKHIAAEVEDLLRST